ncbi:hypothetical protein C2S53_011578 [Perilla frutescens var. hirtella]|uniref:Polygalacturonase n=1 Tax=Perilla frutescens var. hirtella TaxID=608512 RepID=A0AAD4J9A6_PERFH|nr:hypothetical protein C2S53_011578 [Perilla frutescens var. hirtella]
MYPYRVCVFYTNDTITARTYSIGSLGQGGNVVQVENINVGRGNVNGVTFERLTFNDVENPIIINQNYCDVKGKCPELKTGVQISNVTYRNAVGTSASKIAINLSCSKSVPCYGISMESIHLTSAVARRQVTAQCSNARGREDDVVPGPCLLHV